LVCVLMLLAPKYNPSIRDRLSTARCNKIKVRFPRRRFKKQSLAFVCHHGALRPVQE
jgi:hypothetical protein